MALQLGALRDALLDAHVSPEKAAAAAEEVAGYENRLTRLTTMVQTVIAIGLLLLASQAALWMEIGRINGSVTQLTAKTDQLTAKTDQLTAKTDQLTASVDQLSAKVDKIVLAVTK